MRNFTVLIALLALGGAALTAHLALPVADARAEEEPASIAWEKDLASARQRAADEGRPLMVVFR